MLSEAPTRTCAVVITHDMPHKDAFRSSHALLRLALIDWVSLVVGADYIQCLEGSYTRAAELHPWLSPLASVKKLDVKAHVYVDLVYDRQLLTRGRL